MTLAFVPPVVKYAEKATFISDCTEESNAFQLFVTLYVRALIS